MNQSGTESTEQRTEEVRINAHVAAIKSSGSSHLSVNRSSAPSVASSRSRSLQFLPNLQSANRKHRSLDFIGDVHGHVIQLRRLLKLLGYKEKRGVFAHPKRHAVFLGDIINRGPKIRETVHLVYNMVTTGNATLLLGNHEFLALYNHYHPKERAGCPIDQKARKQLTSTLRAYERHRSEWKMFLAWIRKQPLYFETPFVRAIHACWDPLALQYLHNNRLLVSDFTHPFTNRFWSIWQILEGPRLLDTSLPTMFARSRIRWWHTTIRNWQSAAFSNKAHLSDQSLPKRRLSKFSPYPRTDPPLFIGHYGFHKPSKPVTPNLCCIDMGVAQTGQLTAYSWDGEQTLSPTKFVSVNSKN